MTTKPHIIKTQRFELQAASQDHARELQEWVSEWCSTQLKPLLDAACSRYGSGPHPQLIEHLLIDLGTVPPDAFEERFAQELERSLRKALPEVVEDAAGEQEPDRTDLLWHYLLTGTSSWRANHLHASDLSDLLDLLNKRPTRAFQELARQISRHDGGLRRMVATFSDRQLLQTFSQVATADLEPFAQLLNELKAMGSAMQWDSHTLRTSFWLALAPHLELHTTPKALAAPVMSCITLACEAHDALPDIQQHPDRYPMLQMGIEQTNEVTRNLQDLLAAYRELRQLERHHPDLSVVITTMKDVFRRHSVLALSFERRQALVRALQTLIATIQVHAGLPTRPGNPNSLDALAAPMTDATPIGPIQPDHLFDQLVDYLLKGTPAGPSVKGSFPDWVKKLNEHPTPEYRELLRQLGHHHLAMDRMVSACTDAQLLHTFSQVADVDPKPFSRLLTELYAMGTTLQWDQQAVRKAYWQSLVRHLGKGTQALIDEVTGHVLLSSGSDEVRIRRLLQEQPDLHPMVRTWLRGSGKETSDVWWLLTQSRKLQKMETNHPEWTAIVMALANAMTIHPMVTPASDHPDPRSRSVIQSVKALVDITNYTVLLSPEDPPHKAASIAPPVSVWKETGGAKKPHDLLARYLRKGVQPPGTSLPDLLNTLNRQPTPAFQEVIREAFHHEAGILRLVAAFSDALLLETFAKVTVFADLQPFAQLLNELKAMGSAMQWDEPKLRVAFWWSLATHLEGKMPTNKLLIAVTKDVLKRLGTNLEKIKGHLKETEVNYPTVVAGQNQTDKEAGPTRQLKAWSKALRSMKGADPALIAVADALENILNKDAFSERLSGCSTALTQAMAALMELVEQEQNKRTRRADPLAQITHLPSGTEQPTVPTRASLQQGKKATNGRSRPEPDSTIPDRSALDRRGDRPLQEGTRWIVQQSIKKILVLTDHLVGADKKNNPAYALNPFDQADLLPVHNAGLVICWPFLERLFTHLGWVKDHQFTEPEAAHRATQVLYFLESGEPESGFEAGMVLNKLLCGIPLSEPLTPYSLSNEQQQTAEGMLEAVIARGALWKNLSMENLRTSYLQREGLLKTRDGHWLLQVKRETYDITLEKLPWSFQTIKLPWMNALVQVDWI